MATRELHTCDRCGREVESRKDLGLIRIVIYEDAQAGTSGSNIDFPHLEVCRPCRRSLSTELRELLTRRPPDGA